MTASAASAPAPSAPAPAVASAPAATQIAQLAQAVGTPLVPTGPQAPTAGADRVPTGPQVPTAVGPAFGRVVLVDPPGPGQAESVQVFPGSRLVLQDQAFDPSRAAYVVQGNDLVVRTQGSGDVVLLDFFRTDGAQASLSVFGGQPNPSGQLLALAYLEGNDTLIKPGAGPSGPQTPTGGNASFNPYDQGDIGPGLDPLGPLGPTDLRRGLLEGDVGALDDENGPPTPPPPGSETPVVTTTAELTATIAEDSRGFTPPFTQSLPGIVEGDALADDQINGLDPRLATLDADREVSIVFRDEVAGLNNTLIAYYIGDDGALTDARIVFPNVNDFQTGQGFQDGQGPLAAGNTVQLGLVPAGTKIGLALIQGGWDIHGGLLESGEIEIRDAVTGGPFSILTSTGQPVIVHIGANGDESIIYGRPFWTADADPSTPNANALNFDNLGHVVSGFDAASGDLIVAFEDLGRPLGQIDDTPLGDIYSDRDFNDAIFQIHFGPAKTGEIPFFGDSEGSLDAVITDADSALLATASVKVSEGAQSGDELVLEGLADSDGDGLIDGTAIALDRVSDTELEFSGEDSIENYKTVLNAIRYANDSGDIGAGERVFQVSVTDDKGNKSDFSVTRLSVVEDEIFLTSGNDVFVGTDVSEVVAGQNGNDQLSGRGGNDLLVGGDGADELFGDEGDDYLIGLTGQDILFGGAGADQFLSTALGDGQDEVKDFNLDEGDRFNLERLLEGTNFDPNGGDAEDWIRFRPVDVDGDTTPDLAVDVDIDGSGGNYAFSTVFVAFNPVGTNFTIANATTFGDNATV